MRLDSMELILAKLRPSGSGCYSFRNVITGSTPVALDAEPDLPVLVFTAATSIAAGLGFGLFPALRSSRTNFSPDIRGLAGTGGEGQHALRTGKVMVALQVALSVVLLAAASLFVRSLQKLSTRDAGFDRESVLLIRVEPRGSNQRGIPGTEARLDQTYRALFDPAGTQPVPFVFAVNRNGAKVDYKPILNTNGIPPRSREERPN
jgi:hypothetical protein